MYDCLWKHCTFWSPRLFFFCRQRAITSNGSVYGYFIYKKSIGLQILIQSTHSNFFSFAYEICWLVSNFFKSIESSFEGLLDVLNMIFLIFWNGVSKNMVKAMDANVIAIFSFRFSWNDTSWNIRKKKFSPFLEFHVSIFTHRITEETEISSVSRSTNVVEKHWKLRQIDCIR